MQPILALSGGPCPTLFLTYYFVIRRLSPCFKAGRMILKPLLIALIMLEKQLITLNSLQYRCLSFIVKLNFAKKRQTANGYPASLIQ